jgi:hypothetical protein
VRIHETASSSSACRELSLLPRDILNPPPSRSKDKNKKGPHSGTLTLPPLVTPPSPCRPQSSQRRKTYQSRQLSTSLSCIGACSRSESSDVWSQTTRQQIGSEYREDVMNLRCKRPYLGILLQHYRKFFFFFFHAIQFDQMRTASLIFSYVLSS